jgi:hypothetical protein
MTDERLKEIQHLTECSWCEIIEYKKIIMELLAEVHKLRSIE